MNDLVCAVVCCGVPGPLPQGMQKVARRSLHPTAVLHRPQLHGSFQLPESATNWLELFSNQFIPPELGNSDNISFYPLLQPGLHLRHCFPSQVNLFSACNKPIDCSECWLWRFLPQDLEAPIPQYFSPKRENRQQQITVQESTGDRV